MGNRLTENTEIPALDDWITLPEAAEILSVSRQHAYNVAAKGGFDTLHRIGAAVFVVKASEITQKADARAASRE